MTAKPHDVAVRARRMARERGAAVVVDEVEAPDALGPCKWCGLPSWLANAAGEPAHACCELAGSADCPSCRASRRRR